MPKVARKKSKSKVKEQVTTVVPKDRNPGMIMFVSFVVLMVVTSVVVYFANMWFPSSVVLGTANISLLWAVLLSGAVIALIDTFAMPFLREWEMKRKRDLSGKEMMVVYLMINVAAVWLVSRFAEIFGLGVASWVVVLILAAVVNVVQGAVMVSWQKMMEK